MNLIRYRHPAHSTQEADFEKLFDSLFTWPKTLGPFHSTNVEYHEDDKAYYLRLELPGLNKSELNITVTDKVLSIRGQKKGWLGKTTGDSGSGSRIERSFTLPEKVETGKIEAHYEDGVLDLNLPKQEEVKPKEINVQIK